MRSRPNVERLVRLGQKLGLSWHCICSLQRTNCVKDFVTVAHDNDIDDERLIDLVVMVWEITDADVETYTAT